MVQQMSVSRWRSPCHGHPIVPWKCIPYCQIPCLVEQQSWAPAVGGHRYCPCDFEGYDLALVVDERVELQAKEDHGSAAPLGQPLEHPVPRDPCVLP